MSRINLITIACLLVVAWISSLAGLARAYSGPGVVISEVQTGSSASANEEFIEIMNIGEDSVDITNWRIEYKSATGLTWSTKAVLSGELHPGGTILAASTNYITDIATVSFAAGLSKTGGNIRLVSTEASDGSVFVHDALGWGTGNAAEGAAPALYSSEGKSMSRVSADTVSLQDTNNNLVDFMVSDVPTPESHNTAPELPPEAISEDVPGSDLLYIAELPLAAQDIPTAPNLSVPPVAGEAALDAPAPPTTAAKPSISLLISELLANPASPVSDSEGEYVELYNSGETDLSLQGITLQTGLKYSYSYTFADVTIEAGKYKAFYSKETGLSLSNTAGKARLVLQDGTVLYETAVYGAAKDGMAWVLADEKWVWSAQPTPGAENVLVMNTPAATAKPVEKVATKPLAKTVQKKVTAPKAPKTTKPKTKKLKNAAAVRKVYSEPPKADLKTPIHYGVLAGIGSITLLYALYEYRTDFQNRLFQLRRYMAHRREYRQAAKG